MLSLRWLKGFLTQKLSERCSWLSQKHLNSCKVCTKKKTSLRAGDQRQKQGSLWRVTEVQKTTRLRWTRVNTRKNPASRSNELETFSDKVGGDVLGAFEVVGVKVLFHFQLRCQMMWDDVRWLTDGVTHTSDGCETVLVDKQMNNCVRKCLNL